MPNQPSPRPEHIARDLVQRAHSPNTTQDIFRDSVLHKPLFLRPTSFADKPIDARQARQRARDAKVAAKARKSRKPKPLSAKQKRTLCLYDIPKEQQRYEIFEPLHRMWLGYIRDVLGVDATKVEERRFVEAKNAGPILGAADLHGAEVEVVRCRCVGRVGLRGIIAKETKGTFEIITKKNELKVVPKEHTVFRCEVPPDDEERTSSQTPNEKPMGVQNFVFELHGSQFAHRPAQRSSRQIKLHIMPDI